MNIRLQHLSDYNTLSLSSRRPQVAGSSDDTPENQNTFPVSNNKPDDHKLTSPVPGDTASPTWAVNGVKGIIKAATPKLSTAADPFFLDMDGTPSSSKPVNKGVQSLMERYLGF